MSRLHRTLLRVLVADIVSGALPAGERLPTEIELAQRFGVSRGVARESLRSLEERGLVNVKHGSGATVLPSTDWDMFNPDVISALLEGDNGAELLRGGALPRGRRRIPPCRDPCHGQPGTGPDDRAGPSRARRGPTAARTAG